MRNSNLVDVTIKSPNHSGKRTHSLDRITPHVVVGQCTAEALGNLFAKPSRKASCNYGIDKNGRVLLCVDEDNVSQCSSSPSNDNRAITFECASDTFEPFKVKKVVFDKLIEMCVDICRRYGKTRLIWIDNKNVALVYEPKENEMILTAHRWFDAKACPGDYLYGKFGELAKTVTKQLSQLGKYKLNKDLYIRSKPSTTSKKKRKLAKGTVVEVTRIKGNWGYVEEYKGWIAINHCTFTKYKLGTYVLDRDLKARLTTDTKSKVVFKLKKGTYIKVNQIVGKQGNVTIDSKTGWINLKYCYKA